MIKYRVTISNTYMDTYFEFTDITEAERFARAVITNGKRDGKDGAFSATIRLVNEEPEDTIAENEDKANPKRKPVRVCTMPSQGVWCNECTQFFNCDILCGKADKQVIYEDEDEEDEY